MFVSNKVFNIFILVALAVVIFVTAGRINVEKENKTVDFVMDYTELENLASQSNQEVSFWLNHFKDMGINKVGLAEESIDSLIEAGKPIKAELMGDVSKEIDWREKLPETILKAIDGNSVFNKNDILVSTSSSELYAFIKEGFEKRYEESKYFTAENENNYFLYIYSGPKDTLYTPKTKYEDSSQKGFIELREPIYSKLMYLSLGFDDEKVKKIKESNLSIIPRTVGYDEWNGEKFEKATLNEYKKLNTVAPEYLLFAGSEIVGQDEGSKQLKEYVDKNDIKIAMIETTFQRENIDQAGLLDMVQSTDYNTIRAFTTWPYIQNRFQYYNYQGSEEIENTFYRAITERNIRMIYFKPFKEHKDNFIYITDVNEYKRMFESLENRIAKHDISLGSASVMEPYEVGWLAKIIITIGAAAGGMILLSAFIQLKERMRYVLFAIIGALIVIAYSLSETLAEMFSAFGASVVFPCLAIIYLINRWRVYSTQIEKDEKLSRIILEAIKDLLIATFISLVGGLFTASLISDINYLLELNIFRGVKAAQLLPLFIFAIVYLSYIGFKAEHRSSRFNIRVIKEILMSDIKVWVTIIGLGVLAAGYIYIARTGHDTGVEPLKIEMIFRNFLEDYLLARPRNKEFLIAFPALMLSIYAIIRRFKWLPFVLGLAAVIGQTSVVNTFMHLRTPAYLSLTRTAYSLLFGIIIGVAYIILFELIIRGFRRIRGEQT